MRFTIRGEPAAILSLIRSFNETKNPVHRMTVLQSIEGAERERDDTDRVRITLTVLGLHHLGVAGGE